MRDLAKFEIRRTECGGWDRHCGRYLNATDIL